MLYPAEMPRNRRREGRRSVHNALPTTKSQVDDGLWGITNGNLCSSAKQKSCSFLDLMQLSGPQPVGGSWMSRFVLRLASLTSTAVLHLAPLAQRPGRTAAHATTTSTTLLQPI